VTTVDPQSDLGRPPHDVSDHLYPYVSSELAKGRSLSDIARDGLVVFCDAAGKTVRRMKNDYLEQNFRDAEKARTLLWERPDEQYKHAWPTFMGRPLPVPFGAARPSTRQRGRPAKNVASLKNSTFNAHLCAFNESPSMIRNGGDNETGTCKTSRLWRGRTQ